MACKGEKEEKEVFRVLHTEVDTKVMAGLLKASQGGGWRHNKFIVPVAIVCFALQSPRRWLWQGSGRLRL